MRRRHSTQDTQGSAKRLRICTHETETLSNPHVPCPVHVSAGRTHHRGMRIVLIEGGDEQLNIFSVPVLSHCCSRFSCPAVSRTPACATVRGVLEGAGVHVFKDASTNKANGILGILPSSLKPFGLLGD